MVQIHRKPQEDIIEEKEGMEAPLVMAELVGYESQFRKRTRINEKMHLHN